MTKEEKAQEYADGITPVIVSGTEIPATVDDLNEFAQKDYLAGYNEAIRWRDPKEELPEEVGLYLCKCKSNRIGFYFGIVFFNKVWRSNNVIGWRPIE